MFIYPWEQMPISIAIVISIELLIFICSSILNNHIRKKDSDNSARILAYRQYEIVLSECLVVLVLFPWMIAMVIWSSLF